MRSSLRFRQTRHIASMMLFVWLFASVASWSNACLLEPSGATSGARAHHERHDVAAHHRSIHDGAGDATDAHEPDLAREACASFCETEQSVVAKVQASKGDGAADPFSLVSHVFTSWPAFTPGRAEVHWRPLAAPPPPGPPVAIAFLRLTL